MTWLSSLRQINFGRELGIEFSTLSRLDYATPISPDCANPSNSRQETSDNNTSLDLLLGLLNKFFLGASLGGCVHKDRLVGSWRLPVKRARYWLVGGEHITLSGWSFSKRPELYQTIGNCAETYPIVHLLR